jgi:putative FmdB family regulatory protein
VPTYQYQCTECGEPLEAVQKFTDDALTECPNCQGRLRKVFSAVGVVFKGSGFYRNDSRSSSTGGSSAKSEPKAEAKTESKGETKSPAKSEGSGSAAKETKSAPSTPASTGSAAAS